MSHKAEYRFNCFRSVAGTGAAGSAAHYAFLRAEKTTLNDGE
jgi:hypothetical protein